MIQNRTIKIGIAMKKNLRNRKTEGVPGNYFNFPFWLAKPSAFAGTLSGFKIALIRVLVSKTRSIVTGYGKKLSKTLRSNPVSLLMESTSAPASARSIARSSWSGPVGYGSPFKIALSALDVSNFWQAGESFCQTRAVGSSSSIVTVFILQIMKKLPIAIYCLICDSAKICSGNDRRSAKGICNYSHKSYG